MIKQERLGKSKKKILSVLLFCESKGAEGVLKVNIREMLNKGRTNEMKGSELQITLDNMEQQGMIKTKLCTIPGKGKKQFRYCSLTDKGRKLAIKVNEEMLQEANNY